MRVPVIIVAFLLSACAADTNELIQDAHKDGNWTAVNRRLDTEEERGELSALICGSSHQLWCNTSLKETSCDCILRPVAEDRVRRITGPQIRGRTR